LFADGPLGTKNVVVSMVQQSNIGTSRHLRQHSESQSELGKQVVRLYFLRIRVVFLIRIGHFKEKMITYGPVETWTYGCPSAVFHRFQGFVVYEEELH
jgi:hypothetical protein